MEQYEMWIKSALDAVMIFGSLAFVYVVLMVLFG